MGALHEGHLSLVRTSVWHADHIIVSIFVNPTQFGPNEDFDRYPRPLERDLALCRDAGVTGIFNPSVEAVYPPHLPTCQVNLPALADLLEGEMRPLHFGGVCRVVLKLLNIVQPDIAAFGQKDYQQWRIIEAMVEDLMLPVKIVGLPTLREADGLAMSSRNAYLSEEARKHASGIFKALKEARHLIEEEGETSPSAVEEAMTTILKAHRIDPQYAVIRHPRTLLPMDAIAPSLTGGAVALIAGLLDDVRLIDNMLIAADGDSPQAGKPA